MRGGGLWEFEYFGLVCRNRESISLSVFGAICNNPSFCKSRITVALLPVRPPPLPSSAPNHPTCTSAQTLCYSLL